MLKRGERAQGGRVTCKFCDSRTDEDLERWSFGLHNGPGQILTSVRPSLSAGRRQKLDVPCTGHGSESLPTLIRL